MSVIIRLKGLPLSAASADIRSFFGGLRIPDGAVNIVGGEEGDAFIGFATDEDARHAMQKNYGTIHNTEVRLFLSSRTEMKDVIDNARYVPPIPAPSIAQPPSVPPRYRNIPVSPRLEKDMSSRFPPREAPPQFSRDIPSYRRNDLSEKEREPPRYGSDGPPSMNANVRPPFPQNGGFPGSGPFVGNGSRFDERHEKGDGRSTFQLQASNFGFEKNEQRKSDEIGMNGRWTNGNRDTMGGKTEDGKYLADAFTNIRRDDGDRRLPNTGSISSMHERRRNDGDERKEESWRSENNRSFERPPVLNEKEDEPISFFGRGPPTKIPLLPSPTIAPPSFPPSASSHLSTVQPQKEEVFIELSRLPPDLIRPSVLEDFLSPSIPLTLSSVKVVYSPEGIHLSSLVRFTSAMEAFNALKKDGEQGVKIRPSTKEAFDLAHDGPPPPPTLSHLPPSFHPHPLPPPTLSHLPPSFTPHPSSINIPQFPTIPSMSGVMPPPVASRSNLFTMPLINPNEMTMGNERREGRGDRRRREDSPPRGRREEKRRRSMSPRTKKSRGDRICVLLQNLPFRVKEQEIRRLLGPLNPYAIKKVYTIDNSPSDQWIMEFSSEPEAVETVRKRMEIGGRQARLRIVDEPEADRLLKQKFKSPPRRVERDGERRDSFDEKVRMQQEAIERMNGSGDSSNALAGAFNGPVFTSSRGFMRGGRGGGMRGIRGAINNGMRGGRGRGGVIMGGNGIGRRVSERNCLLVSNMPPLPAPQILLEHLRIIPSQLIRIDQIAPDAAIIELKSEIDAVSVAENTSGELFPHLNGIRLIVAAMGRMQIEEELNLRREENNSKEQSSHPSIDLDLIKSIGEPGCVISCDGFPHDLSIEAVKLFFSGFSVIDSSVRMRMEEGKGTGECLLSLMNRSAAMRAVETLNGKVFRGSIVNLSLL